MVKSYAILDGFKADNLYGKKDILTGPVFGCEFLI